VGDPNMTPEDLDTLASQVELIDEMAADEIHDSIVNTAIVAASRAIDPQCGLGYYLSNMPAFEDLSSLISRLRTTVMSRLRTTITEQSMGMGEKPNT